MTDIMTVRGLNAAPDTSNGPDMRYLRDMVIRAFEMTNPNFNRSRDPAEKVARIGEYLSLAIDADPTMAGFLGRPNGDKSRDILSGNGSLED